MSAILSPSPVSGPLPLGSPLVASGDRPIAALSGALVIAAHVAAAWLIWVLPGAARIDPPQPLAVRLLEDVAPDAPPKPLPAAAPVPEPVRKVRPTPQRRAAASPAPRSAPVRTLVAEATAPSTAEPVVPVSPRTDPAPAVNAPVAVETPASRPSAAAPAPAHSPAPVPAPAAAPKTVAPRFDAAYLSNPAPVYPPLSRRLGEEGKVVLRVHVEPDGQPSHVELRTSSGFARLDEAALGAVRRWRFVPARRGDEAVAAWVLVPLNFTLNSF